MCQCLYTSQLIAPQLRGLCLHSSFTLHFWRDISGTSLTAWKCLLWTIVCFQNQLSDMFVNHSDISAEKKPNQVGYSEVQSEGYSGIYMCLKNPIDANRSPLFPHTGPLRVHWRWCIIQQTLIFPIKREQCAFTGYLYLYVWYFGTLVK